MRGEGNASPGLTARLIEIFKPDDLELFQSLAEGYVPISDEEYDRGLGPKTKPRSYKKDIKGRPYVLSRR